MPCNRGFNVMFAAVLVGIFGGAVAASEPIPMFNAEGECGTGAVVPWADRLWLISYGPHKPFGSTDKMYEITPGLEQIIRPESVGGTPANRTIHRESPQLVIVPCFIDTNRNVRVVAPKFMPGRLTANARDLTDPANRIYFATMEEGLYEVDMHSLAVTGLIQDNNLPPPGQTGETNLAKIKSALPGYHDKGLYCGQGRLVYAQNGQRRKAAKTNPATTSGALAEWRESEMFAGLAQTGDTQISGGLLHQRGGNTRTLQCISADRKTARYELDENLKLRRTNDPTSVAWAKSNLAIPRDFLTVDKSSVVCVDNGHRWRLPKGDASFETAAATDDEWVCREVVTEQDLFNAFGTFYELPAESAGGFTKIRPIATHNRHIKDYARYRGLLAMSGDRNAARGEHIVRSDDGKCALWVGAADDLWQLGKPHGIGGPWLDTALKANEPSDAYLATGCNQKRLTLSHLSTEVVGFKAQADFTGTGEWRDVVTLAVKPGERREYDFPAAFAAYWFRAIAASNTVATAQFDYR